MKKGSHPASICLWLRDFQSQPWLPVCLATLQQFVLSEPYKTLVASKFRNKFIYRLIANSGEKKIHPSFLVWDLEFEVLD